MTGSGDHTVKASYTVANGDDGKGDITTRSVWVVAEVNGRMPRMVCPDPTSTATYTATIVKSGLTGATTEFEILLTGQNLPCAGDSFTIGNSDKLKVTITPDSSNSFQTAPTVSATNATVGTVTSASGGSYTCEITKFTDASTITVSGAVKVPKTEVTITGLSKEDSTYNGAAQEGYTGTANLSPSGFTGTLEYTYYSGSSAIGTPLSGAPTNAGTYTVVAAIPDSDATYAGAHAPITFTIAPKSVNVTLGSGSVTKVYDGATTAGTGAITLNTSDIISADTGVTVVAGTIPAYSAAAVGSSYSLAVPVTLNGDSNNNYTLTNSTVTVPGEITAKPVTLADGNLAITKEYDGTNGAGTATGALSCNDFVAADSGDVSVTVTSVGAYADASVGTTKTVTLNVELTGSAAGNYSLANSTYSFAKAEITKATPAVNVTAVKKADSFLRSIIGSKDDTFTITATVIGVNGEKPTGTVQLKTNSTALGNAITLNNGVATYEWVQPSTSTYTITADFTATGDNYTNATGTSEQYDISKAEQAVLTFTGVPTTASYGDSKITFATTGGSGNGAVTYASSDTDMITNDGTIKGKGTVTITATKEGDTDYNAKEAIITITVNAAAPTVTWEKATQSVTYTGNTATITAPKVTLKNSETYNGSIQYAYKKTGLFSLFAGYTDGLPTDAGKYEIKAKIAATGNYAEAETATALTLTINKSTPVLTINTMNGKTYDGTAVVHPAESGMTITGANYADVKFAYSAAQDMSNPSTTAPKNAGTYYVQASVAAGDNTNAAQSTAKSFTINKVALTVTGGTVTQREYDGTTTATVTALTFNGLATDESLVLGTDYTVTNAAYADADVSDSKSITAGTVALVDTTIANNYSLADGNLSGKGITGKIAKTDQDPLTFTTTSPVTYGDSTISFGATGGSGTDAITYKSSEPTFITDSGEIKGVGTTIITATRAADTNYNAVQATVTIKVISATPTIAWSNTTQELTYDGSVAKITSPTVTLVNSESYTGIIQYAYKSTGFNLFSLFTGYTDGLPTDAGEYEIKAKIAAEGNYTKAETTTALTLTIKKSTPSITIKTSYTGKDYDGTAMEKPTIGDLTITGADYDDVKFAYSTGNDMSSTITGIPKNAGSYSVQASIDEGDNTTVATSNVYNFTIAQAALNITGGTAKEKAWDNTSSAEITAITFDKEIANNELKLGTDYTINNAAYADSNAADNKAVASGSVVLAGIAKANNYTLTPSGLISAMNIKGNIKKLTRRKGEEYKFQILYKSGKPDNALKVFENVNQLYKEAYIRYIDQGSVVADEIDPKELAK